MQDFKSQFLGSVRRKFSVSIKMNDFLGILYEANFTPCCYILLSGIRLKRRCTHAY